MYEDIYVIGNKLSLVDPNEIDKAEQQLGQKMPPGYQEFMTQLGRGTYCTWIELLLPQSVIQESKHWQEMWSQHWNRTSRNNTINKENIHECLWIAKDNANSLVHHPSQGKYFVIDRDDDDVPFVGSTLAEGLKALVANRHGYPLSIQYFTPDIDRFTEGLMLDEENPDELENIITTIQHLNLHDQFEIHEWGVNFFLKDILGYLSIDYTGSDYVADINCDESVKSHEKVEMLYQTLNELGFEEYY